MFCCGRLFLHFILIGLGALYCTCTAQNVQGLTVIENLDLSPNLIRFTWPSNSNPTKLEYREKGTQAWQSVALSVSALEQRIYDFDRPSFCKTYEFRLAAGDRPLGQQAVTVKPPIPIIPGNELKPRVFTHEYASNTQQLKTVLRWPLPQLEAWSTDYLIIDTHIHTVICASGLSPTVQTINSTSAVVTYGSHVVDAVSSGRQCTYVFMIQSMKTQCGDSIKIHIPENQPVAVTYQLECRGMPGLDCSRITRAPEAVYYCAANELISGPTANLPGSSTLSWTFPVHDQYFPKRPVLRYIIRYGRVLEKFLPILSQTLEEMGLINVDGSQSETVIQDKRFVQNELYRAEICAVFDSNPVEGPHWFGPGVFELNVAPPCRVPSLLELAVKPELNNSVRARR